MKSVSAGFPCGDIRLEGEWLLPEGRGPFPAVVVCHPYPPMGGSMFNNVVTAIWQALAENDIAAFRFNFRGVGGSEGSFGEGVAEQEDVKAAIDYVLSSADVDAGRFGLAGYSFGAAMAFLVAHEDERVGPLAIVSAPLSDKNWQQLKEYKHPRLYLVGDADQMIPRERSLQQAGSFLNPGQFQLIPGADHSLAGYEDAVARKLADFFAESFDSVKANLK